MRDSCYFSAFEDEKDVELCIDELRNLKILQNPIFDEPIYVQKSAQQEQALQRAFNEYCQGKTGLVDCNGTVQLLLKKGIIKDALRGRKPGKLTCKNYEEDDSVSVAAYSESSISIRQRDVEDAFNMAKPKHERKINFELFKRMLGILGARLYPECSKAQAFELMKARVLQSKQRQQRINF